MVGGMDGLIIEELNELVDEQAAEIERLREDNARLVQDCARIASENACHMIDARRLRKIIADAHYELTCGTVKDTLEKLSMTIDTATAHQDAPQEPDSP